MAGTLIDHLISVANKSGAIPSAPQGLKKLKESIEGLPFELLTKSMSGIFDQIQQQVQQLTQAMGGVQNMVANGDKAMNQVQQNLAQIQNGTATADQLVQAFGGVTAMTAGLAAHLSADDLKSVRNLAPSANTGG